MKKVISTFAILVMIGALCTGCKDKEADKPKPEATQQSQQSNAKVCASETSKQSEKSCAKDWEPETSKQPTANSPQQDGHDHSAGGHSGHNH